MNGAGNAFVVGETPSSDFPTTSGAFRRTKAGQIDMFVTKLNPAGSALAYSTFLGGTQVDNGQSVGVDSGGNAYALGATSSTNFPTTAGAFDRTANGGFDATLTKLNPAGAALVNSTYLGGQDFDGGNDVTLDSARNAYVAGTTTSPDFPTTPGAFDRTPDGNDGFVTKFNAAGSALIYSTVLGGSASDSANGIVLDDAGNAWLAANTTSANFPASADAPDPRISGGSDAVIAKLNASGSALPFATFLGGSQSEGANDIGRDSAGNLYITGNTFSMDFPATIGAFDTDWNGDLSIFWGDAFVSKLSLTGGSTPPAPPPVPAAPTLLAPANGASPEQPVGFDWSDVTSAASYTIEIDDSSSFTAPLVRTQTVTSSSYLAGGLPTTNQFWRVRGINFAGTPGAYSATRSFRPQAAPAPTTLTNLDVNPAQVAGGDGSSGTLITWRVDPTLLGGRFSGRAALLSPLDRLVYDRKRTLEIFEFDYQLEMYKPAATRRWGYFALPILYGDRLVGKLDATADRNAGVLRVNAIHEDVPFTKTMTTAVDREIKDLARWLELDLVLA